jgi:hypothetical protein
VDAKNIHESAGVQPHLPVGSFVAALVGHKAAG